VTVATERAVQPTSLREQAIREVRAAIVYGELDPGEIYSAALLADRLRVSVTPVREAMLELAKRGMVEPVRNRGFRVLERSARELDQTLELRMLIEVPTIARLAGALDAGTTERLDRLVRDGIAAARRADLGAFLDIDRSFHLGLLDQAGNRRIVDIVDELRDQLRFARFRQRRDVSMLDVAEGHRAILAAVVAGDTAAAEHEARAHLLLTRRGWGDPPALELDPTPDG
jgi:DNA-binding GntR family transcriptional regulator